MPDQAEIADVMDDLTDEISDLQGELNQNKKDLKRLKKVQNSILTEQKELMDHKDDINEPELTQNKWSGKHAKKFDSMREDMEKAFKGIGKNQVDLILDRIKEKVNSLQNSITSAENSISMKHNEIARLRNL